MIVSDVMTLNVPFRIFDEPLHVSISPDYKGKFLAVGVQFHGFKRAGIVSSRRARDLRLRYGICASLAV